LITLASLNLVEQVYVHVKPVFVLHVLSYIHVEHVYVLTISFYIHVELVYVLHVQIVIPLDTFKQHLPKIFFQPEIR
jgi:hypothetical protein